MFKDNLDEMTSANTTSGRTYFCGICGKAHKTIEERSACETKCIKEKQEAEEKLKKQKLEEEKNKRMDEIESLIEKLHELICSYVKDYGSIKLDCMGDSFPTLRKLIGDWWF